MELEKQVCSLELAKKLEDLGVTQESLFYWFDGGEKQIALTYKTNIGGVFSNGAGLAKEYFEQENCYSAFTVAELGEMLPVTIGERTWLSWVKSENSFEDTFRISYDKWEKNEGAGQLLIKHIVEFTHYEVKTEADARAKMLIYLIESNLMHKGARDKS